MLQKWMNLSLKTNKSSDSDIYFSLVITSLPHVLLFDCLWQPAKEVEIAPDLPPPQAFIDMLD